MEDQNAHFRHILLYYFRKGKSASQAHRKLCDVYGREALKERQCQNWFAKFRSGNFSLKNADKSGRPATVNENRIKTIVDSDRRISTRQIAEKLNVSHTCIEKKLKQLGYIKKLGFWVPHELKEEHLTQRISVCCSLLKRHENEPFLKRLITGGIMGLDYTGKWQSGRKKKRILLSVWWDYKGVLYFDLLTKQQRINSNIYNEQLTKLGKAIEEKRPELLDLKVVFLLGNTKPSMSSDICEKLVELGWDVLPHPLQSPDLSPSDFHLFYSLQNSLNGKVFVEADDLKSHLNEFFVRKNQKFYKMGIMTLPERWQRVLNKNGEFLIMHNDFKLVKGKRQKKQKTKFDKSTEYSVCESRVIFNRKLEKAVEEFQSSQFCFELLQTIDNCLISVGLKSVDEILCYGIGNFSESKSSLHQLAALINIHRKYNSPAAIYDPVLNSLEIEILKGLSFNVLLVNEEGKRRITKQKVTLAFLPHCPKQLTNNFLWANWSNSLCNCILIANSFSKIIQDNTKKVLQESANYIVKIKEKTKEIPLEDCYHIENTFNDISVHYFEPQGLDPKYFLDTLEQEPQYSEEAELVTNTLASLSIKNE